MENLPLYEENLIAHDAETGLALPRWLDPATQAQDEDAHLLAELIEAYAKPDLLDPLRFIEVQIERLLTQSGALPGIKRTIDSRTLIRVDFTTRPSNMGFIGTSTPKRSTRHFELRDIVTDQHLVELEDKALVKVIWPRDFPPALIDSLENADLQTLYREQVLAHFTHPDNEYVYKLLAKQTLAARLQSYAAKANTSDSYRKLVKGYLDNKVHPKTVRFQNRYTVTQAVYLEANVALTGTIPRAALLVFLGASDTDAVIELPAPAAGRKAVVESSTLLAELIYARLKLYDRLAIGSFSMKYTGIMERSNDFLRKPSLTFHKTDDIISYLYLTHLEHTLSDMDTLVSTRHERMMDKLLELGGVVMTVMSMAVMMPTIGAGLTARPLLAFLFGMGTVGVEVARGSLADHPDEADEHYRAAIIAALAEMVGLIAPAILRFGLAKPDKRALTNTVLKRMRFDGVAPPLYHDIPVMKRNIIPSELGAMHLKRRLIERLRKGPNAAQDMVYEYARATRQTVEGHELIIYRGQVFRGDMRPPKTIFKEGFELRTPADEIRRDIHQVTGVRGGFGGGRNALDPDGKGISTSAFYYKEHTGAYVYGGQRGGYTYVIDTVDMDGYHLYANHHMAKYPNTRHINLRPTEINYGENIPPDIILGAYDKSGNFIPNDIALDYFARRRASEIEVQLAEAAAQAAKKAAIQEAADRVKNNSV
ncbi:hypothetical protein [Pseudomonas abietaniphila]|uniref:hypothetical protein n=1 Tax=Pseudomonas abietaniphila TaxID=89065 RepID=UPI000780AF76|nr:hypothetical protein [Pseudomonas abietaniphila]